MARRAPLRRVLGAATVALTAGAITIGLFVVAWVLWIYERCYGNADCFS